MVFVTLLTNAKMAWLLLLLSLVATCSGEVAVTKQYTLRPLKYPSPYVTSNAMPDGHTITAYAGDSCAFGFMSCDSNLLCTAKDLCQFEESVETVYSLTPYDKSIYVLFDARDENLKTNIAIAKCDMSMSKCSTTNVSDKNNKFSSRHGLIATSSGLNIVYSDSKSSAFITRCNLDLSNCAETNVTAKAGKQFEYFNDGGPIVVQNSIYLPSIDNNTIVAYICGIDRNSQCSYTTIYTFPANVEVGLFVYSSYKDRKLYMSTDATITEETLTDPIYGTYDTKRTDVAYMVSCNVDNTKDCESSYSAFFNKTISSPEICGSILTKDFVVSMYTSYSAYNKGNIIIMGYPPNIKSAPTIANVSTSAGINDYYVSLISTTMNSMIITYETNGNPYSLHAAFANLSPDKHPVSIPNQKPTKKPTKKPTAKKPTKKPTAKKPTPKPTAKKPTKKPTAKKPTPKPTAKKPTSKPTPKPTPKPTLKPTPKPTQKPTLKPTPKPTQKPTLKPTPKPTPKPTLKPTPKPTPKPTLKPTPKPTPKPTLAPAPTHTDTLGPVSYEANYPGGTVAMDWQDSFPTDLYGYVAPFDGSIVGISGSAGGDTAGCATNCGAFVISVRINGTEVVHPTNNFPLGSYDQLGEGSVKLSVSFKGGDVISVYFGASTAVNMRAYAQLSLSWNYITLGPAWYDADYPGGPVQMNVPAFLPVAGSIVGISGSAGASISSCDDCSFVISVRINGTELVAPAKNFPLQTYDRPGNGYVKFDIESFMIHRDDALAVYLGASTAIPIRALAWLTVALPPAAGRKLLGYSNGTAVSYNTMDGMIFGLQH